MDRQVEQNRVVGERRIPDENDPHPCPRRFGEFKYFGRDGTLTVRANWPISLNVRRLSGHEAPEVGERGRIQAR